MFTKKYLAIATLAALTPGMASALTITSTAQTGTTEGLTGVDDVTAGATVVTTGVPYVANDIVSVTYGSVLDEGFSPATTTIVCADTTDSNKVAGDALFRGQDSMSIQYNSTSADRKTVDYVVTAFGGTALAGTGNGVNATNAAASDGIGMACTIAGAAFNGNDMIAAKVAATGLALPVSASSKSSLTSNVKEATAATASANAFTVQVLPQFALADAANEMTASINVSASPLPRGKFASISGGATINAAGTTLTSAFTIPAADAGEDNNATSAATGHTASLTGDFSWMLKADGTMKTGYSVVATDEASATPAVTCTATACSWTVTKAHLDAGEAYAVVLTTDGKTTIPTASWTQTLVASYANQDGQAQTAKTMSDAAGAWSINGAGITVFGIPNSTSAELMLHISNKGTQTGAISVALICDSVTTSASFSAGNLISKGSKSISAAVTAAARADCGATSRYDAVVTINAPLTDVTAVAGYKILQAEGNDRLPLETTQTLN
jgi:hypothetical protein